MMSLNFLIIVSTRLLARRLYWIWTAVASRHDYTIGTIIRKMKVIQWTFGKFGSYFPFRGRKSCILSSKSDFLACKHCDWALWRHFRPARRASPHILHTATPPTFSMKAWPRRKCLLKASMNFKIMQKKALKNQANPCTVSALPRKWYNVTTPLFTMVLYVCSVLDQPIQVNLSLATVEKITAKPFEVR